MENKNKQELLAFTLDFDDDMKLSLNKVWSGGPGTQWVRKKSADLWHDAIWELLEEENFPKIKEKVNIELEFYFSTGDNGRSRQLDSSNCAAMGKMVEDSLRYDKEKNPKGILVNDTSEYVGWFCLHSVELSLKERKEMESSYVEVRIYKNS